MSHWNTDSNDRCEFCGALLIPEHVTQKKQDDLDKEQIREESVLDIKEGDSKFVIFLKKTGWVFQMIFTAILTFFLWLISIATG
jgi:hypothetical protein